MIYTFENKIILEEFAQKRTQSVLNIPEIVSCIDIGLNGVDLAIGAATTNPEIFAPVRMILI